VLDCVALVLNFSTLRKKALATFGATATKDIATILGGHAGTEAELILAATLGRLIGPLAHNKKDGCL
jgi:hypothetical protein